jgi:hypothetical protein
LNVTTPLPLPDAPPVTVSHDVSLLTAVQAQPLGAVTLVVFEPPAAVIARLVGVSEYVQLIAAWVIVKVCPAIVTVPLRWLLVPFGATLYGTVPLPVPEVAPVSVIHDALLDADQVQPVPAVTETLPVVALCATDLLVGEIDDEHTELNEKVLEMVLLVEPPGPTAATRASKLTPGVGSTDSSGRKSTLITPSEPGDGLPRLTVVKATDDPTG